MMTHFQNKMDALKSEYATYSRMLKETENSLTKANGVSLTCYCKYVN